MSSPICVLFSQSLLTGANQLRDLTNNSEYFDLLGLTWAQIRAAFPNRLLQLADKTYEAVQRSKASNHVMAAFGVTDEVPTVASMTSEQRLQRLECIMNDRYGCASF